MKNYSTKQAAKMAGVHHVTLLRWVGAKKVRPSIGVPMDGKTLWRWTDSDVQRLRGYKAAHYGKGKGPRKPKAH